MGQAAVIHDRFKSTVPPLKGPPCHDSPTTGNQSNHLAPAVKGASEVVSALSLARRRCPMAVGAIAGGVPFQANPDNPIVSDS